MAKKSQAKAQSIEFIAAVARIQTMADGGIRATLDLSEGAIMQAAQLMECKRQGVPVKFVGQPYMGEIEKDNHHGDWLEV